jgi:cytochrome P450
MQSSGLPRDPSQPICYDARAGAWSVCAYDLVKQVLGDRVHFSLGVSAQDQRFGNATLAGLWAADGQRHDDLLRLVAAGFRPDAVASLEASITRIVAELIDAAAAAGDGHLEAVSALAHPLPGAVICDLLGIPRDAAARMHRWREEAYQAGGTSTRMPPQPEMAGYFQELIEQGRREPRPGLLGELLAAQAAGARIDGCPLRDRDLQGCLAMFVWGGAETTAGAAADALLYLTAHGYWAALREAPSRIPTAVEEVLRWASTFPAVPQLVVADTTVGGQQLREGDWVVAWLSAANRDPRVFPDPDRFDPDRRPNPHLTFGLGGHYCLGAPLARLELRVLIEQATRRLPHLRPDPDRPAQRRAWLGMEDALPVLHLRY